MEHLINFRDYEVEFYNTPVSKRGNKKRLIIFTNGTIDQDNNHRIEVISTVLNHDLKTGVTTKKEVIEFCTGSTWDSGPIGMHTAVEFVQWMQNNPKWTVKFLSD